MLREARLMTTVTITLDDKDAQALLARAGASGKNEKAMRAASLAMKQLVYNAFRFTTAPDGSQWKKLSEATLASRKRRMQGIDPLKATNAMYNGIEAANTATDASVTIGEGLPDARAWYNQFGTLRNPARAMLPIGTMGTSNPTQAWLDAVLEPVRDAMNEAVEA